MRLPVCLCRTFSKSLTFSVKSSEFIYLFIFIKQATLIEKKEKGDQ